MADSQNTYQNDVKIKSGVSFSTILNIIIAIVMVGYGVYSFYDSQITEAYNNGYETAKVEEYNKGYKKGKEEGKKLGYSDGYSDGYNQGKEDAKSSSKGSSNSYSSSNNYSGGYSGSNNYSSNDEKEITYVLNKNTKKFHKPNCRSVTASPENGGMKEKNKAYFNGTRSEAINKGYSPCKNCNP